MFSTYSWCDVGDVDALDDERAAALAIEQRAEDEARIGPRPTQPLHGALGDEGVVRAVTDDSEHARHESPVERVR